MHTVPAYARKGFLTALVALTLLAGALFVATPNASAGLGQCPANAVCIWQNSDASGNFSWWPAGSTGCHDHINNPVIRTAYNNTVGYRVRVGGGATIDPGVVYVHEAGITGQICWPV